MKLYTSFFALAILLSTSALASEIIGIPKRTHEIRYIYFNKILQPVGGKTFHCDNTITQFGYPSNHAAIKTIEVYKVPCE